MSIRNVLKAIFPIVITLSSVSVQAKTLACLETRSFANRSFSINRDGSIGFNGTYLTVKAPISLWPARLSLQSLTGREQDADSSLQELELPISPKQTCSSPDGEVGTAFHCSVKNADIDAIAVARVEKTDAPVEFETVTTRASLRADVEVDFAVSGNQYILTGTVTQPSSGKSIQFKIIPNARDCKVEE